MKLEDIKKDNPFKVPDNYFDDFYSRLENKLEKEKVKTHKIIYLKPLFAIAASIMLILLLSKPISISENFTSRSTIQIELTDDDMVEYIASTSSDYEIFEALNN